MGRCYESGFWGEGDKGEPVYQNTTDTNKPYPHKASSFVSSQKGKLPTTVQCEKTAVEAPDGAHPFYISYKDSYKGGVIWMLEEECGQAGGEGKDVLSTEKGLSKCPDVAVVSRSGPAGNALQLEHRMGLEAEEGRLGASCEEV